MKANKGMLYSDPAEFKQDLLEYTALSFDAIESLADVDPTMKLSAQDLHRLRDLQSECLTLIERAEVSRPKPSLRRIK